MKALIVGLGRMGERYLTTLNRMYGQDIEITTVDPINTPETSHFHFKDLDDVDSNLSFDLAIDARPNKNRLKFLEKLIHREIPRIIVEKPHASSLKESLEMIQLVESHSKTQVMVPFYRRFSPLFDSNELSKLEAGPLQSLSITSGAIGLGCNGVHLLDSANFIFQQNPKSIFSSIQNNSIPSPRGEEFADHSGTLFVEYENNKKLILNILDESSQGISTVYSFKNGKIVVNEQQSPYWKWYRRQSEHTDLPIYRTHMEAEVQPPMEYKLDLFELIEKGIKTFISAPEQTPTLTNGHTVLKTIALAIDSSERGLRLNFDDQGTLEKLNSIPFKFT